MSLDISRFFLPFSFVALKMKRRYKPQMDITFSWC